MTEGICAFLAGVWLLQQLPALPAPSWSWLMPLLLPALGRGPWLRLPAALSLGFLLALVQAHWNLGYRLQPELEGKSLQVTGTLASVVQEDARRLRFDLEPDTLTLAGQAVPAPRRIRLSWYRSDQRPRPGERWRLLVRLKRPRGFANPAGFDYAGWLYRQGVDATGYVRSSPLNRRLGPPRWDSLLLRLRHRIGRLIDLRVANRPGAGLLRALVIGDRSGLEREQRELLRRTGTSHLVAISGLHIGIVAGFGFLLGRFLWGRSSLLSGRFAAQRAGAVAGLGAALLYAALAGFSIPTRRALIMTAVVLGGVALNRPVRPSRALAQVLLLVLLTDTGAVLAPGFWLSFGAVAVILGALSGRLHRPATAAGVGRIQLAVSLGLLPLLLAWSLPVSLASPLINLLLVPLFSMLVVPLALLATLAGLVSDALGGLLFHGLGMALEWFWSGLGLIDTMTASWQLAGGVERPLWQVVALVGGVLLLQSPAGIPGRWLGLLPLLLLIWPPTPPPPRPGGFRFDLLDVGQGMAAVIRTRQHTLVYDAGPRYSARFDAGRAILAPFLQWSGVGRIDRLILSNGDADHSGGARGLLREIPAGRIQSGEPERIGLVGVEPCRAGEAWSWDGVRFRFLHPTAGEWRGNDASCVLRVEGRAGSLLLTGDIERPAERSLLRQAGRQLDVDLVVVPHHGSRTSSSPGLVAATSPRFALVAAGYRNRFGFPRPEVVARWRAAGATVAGTAGEGAIHFEFGADGELTGPSGWRRDHARYWNGDP